MSYSELEPFSLGHNQLTAPGVLSRNVTRFRSPRGANLTERYDPLWQWISDRQDAGVFQFACGWNKNPNTRVEGRTASFRKFEGLNFTTVDYLGLSSHPSVRTEARRALDEVGVHSVSVGGLMGNYPLSDQLEDALKDWLGYEEAVLFPTGWAASFGAVTGLVRDGDVVIMDELAHASLQQGAMAATQKVRRFAHLENSAAETLIAAARAEDADAGIMVITEGMYSMDGDMPDLKELLGICRQYNATLLVDVCHDLAACGPSGTGGVGLHGLLGDVDIVVGAFSKCLCTNGGFAVMNGSGAKYAMKFFGGSYTYSTAMTPPQVGAALEAIRIVRGAEGDALRKRLGDVSAYIRQGFQAAGMTVSGDRRSHIVPVSLGREGFARIAGARAMEMGVVATVIEFPVVALGAARYRFSMRPDFTEGELDEAIKTVRSAMDDARSLYASMRPL